MTSTASLATEARPSKGSRRLTAARELLWSLVARDLIVRYRVAAMGVAWALITPLAQMLVFTLVFARVARVDVGMPYPLYAYIGLTAWTLTASSLREATNSLTANPVLLTKVSFPREVLPIAPLCTATVDFLIATLLIGGLMWTYGVVPSWLLVLLPIIFAVHLMLLTALALLLAVANLLWRDVRHVLDLMMMLWMFASSVVYPAQRVSGRAGAALALNPLTLIIEAYRDVLVRGRSPFGLGFAFVVVGSLGLLVFAWLVFQRNERRFAELV